MEKKNYQVINENFIYHPIESKEPILNLGCGLTFPNYGRNQKLSNDIKKWCNIAYKRFTWADLEPSKKHFKFQIIKKWINDRKKEGLRVSFGVLSSNVTRQCSPRWLFENGVPGEVHRKGKQIDPVYWNKKYLQYLSCFIKEMGQSLNAGIGIEFIDMRNIGVFGEMHFGNSKKGMWTKNELKKNGFTKQKYINAYKQMIISYKRAFYRTNLFLNIAPGRKRANKIFNTKGYSWITPGKDEVIDYAVNEGINIRYDGLSIKGTISLKVISSYFNDYGFHRKNKMVGIKCLYEFGQRENNFLTIKYLLDLATQNPVSYINLNFAYFDKMSPKTIDILYETAKKIGYRFVLKEIDFPRSFELKRSMTTPLYFKQIWENKGISPCYKSFALQFSLLNQNNRQILVQKNFPEIETWKWEPNKPVKIRSKILFPDGLKPGIYQMKILMYDPDKEGSNIRLAICNRDDEFGYSLFRVKVIKKAGIMTIAPI